MKNAMIAAAVLFLALAVPAFAADDKQPPNPSGQTFEQRQAQILKMFDVRIADLQEGKTCVQAAKNDGDLRVCREKQLTEMKEKNGEMRMQGGPVGPQRGMMGGPQGQ
jgi:hypothetical protein